MNTVDPVPPIPSNFGWRYVGWFLWCNAITILQIVQTATATVLVASDPTDPHPLIPHMVLKGIVLANAILTGVIAVVKKNNPPGPAPAPK